jgi:hypothetical protein
VARQYAVEQLDYPRCLLRMTELELLDRERRATERRIRQARFPVIETTDSFDFLAIPTLDKTLVLELAQCEFLARRENGCWATAVRAERTSPWHSAWLPASVAIACASPPPVSELIEAPPKAPRGRRAASATLQRPFSPKYPTTACPSIG